MDKNKRECRTEFIVSVTQHTITVTGIGYNLYLTITKG